MFKKAFHLVLAGILAVGAATLAYGTFFDQGLAASAAGLVGAGDDEHEEGHKDD